MFLLVISSYKGGRAYFAYFFPQLLGSMVYVWRALRGCHHRGTLLAVGIFIKMGAYPFHLWNIYLIQQLSWSIGLVLLTLQKMGPSIVIIMWGSGSWVLISIVAFLPSYILLFINTFKKCFIVSTIIFPLYFLCLSGSYLYYWFLYFFVFRVIYYIVFKTSHLNYKKISLLLMFILVGIPPLGTFLFKLVFLWVVRGSTLIYIFILSYIFFSVMAIKFIIFLFFIQKSHWMMSGGHSWALRWGGTILVNRLVFI